MAVRPSPSEDPIVAATDDSSSLASWRQVKDDSRAESELFSASTSRFSHPEYLESADQNETPVEFAPVPKPKMPKRRSQDQAGVNLKGTVLLEMIAIMTVPSTTYIDLGNTQDIGIQLVDPDPAAPDCVSKDDETQTEEGGRQS
ncbi:hypothetical protein BGZ83_009972 [Gryganskiella cystojenkinii]|nr:hypothetical protein BGZ83_009972 [Gryganskiella cystojenkinii]